MIFKTMSDATQSLLQKIHEHPFNVELAEGSLPEEKFIFYLIQDTFYLSEFARALALAAARLPNHPHMQQFIQFTLGAIQAEQTLHAEYIHNHRQKQMIFANSEPGPACFMYSNYLLKTVSLASIEEAIACLLPCFVVYHDVGKKMLSHQHQAHPYHDWIALYAGEDFEASVLTAIQITNELGDAASIPLKEKMTTAYIRSTQLEWKFWHSAYHQEQWLI